MDQKVAARLSEWALKEMRFQSHENHDKNANISSDLSGICIGPLVDVWSYVVKHVKSASTADKVKGNLKLNSGRKCQEEEKLSQLIAERDRLRKDVAELERGDHLLDDNVRDMNAVTRDKCKKVETLTETFKDLRRFLVLEKELERGLQKDVKSIGGSIQELERMSQSLTPKLSCETDVDRFKINLEEMCKSMEASLDEFSNEEPNMDAVHNSKLSTGNNLATLLEQLPHHLLIGLLNEMQDAELDNLQNLLKKMCSFSEADKQYSVDLDSNKIRPLQKLLYELSTYHKQLLSTSSRTQRQAEAAEQEVAALRADLYSLVGNIFADGDEQTARQLIDAELQVSSRKASVEALRSQLLQLEKSCLERAATEAEFKMQLMKLESNAKLADHLSTLICALVRKHGDNPRRIEQVISHLQSVAKQYLKESQENLCKLLSETKNYVGEEFQLFYKIKPQSFFHIAIDKKWSAVDRLCIHRLHACNYLSSSNNLFENALHKLQLNRQLPVYNVLHAVMENKSRISRMHRAINWHQIRRREIADKYGLVWLEQGAAHCKELGRELEDKRQKQQDGLLPPLANGLKKLTDVNGILSSVETALSEWIQEPAKLIETGRTVDGLTLAQWHQQWDKLLAIHRSSN